MHANGSVNGARPYGGQFGDLENCRGMSPLAQQSHCREFILQRTARVQMGHAQALMAAVLVMVEIGDSPGVHCLGLVPAIPPPHAPCAVGAILRGKAGLSQPSLACPQELQSPPAPSCAVHRTPFPWRSTLGLLAHGGQGSPWEGMIYACLLGSTAPSASTRGVWCLASPCLLCRPSHFVPVSCRYSDHLITPWFCLLPWRRYTCLRSS